MSESIYFSESFIQPNFSFSLESMDVVLNPVCFLRSFLDFLLHLMIWEDQRHSFQGVILISLSGFSILIEFSSKQLYEFMGLPNEGNSPSISLQ